MGRDRLHQLLSGLRRDRPGRGARPGGARHGYARRAERPVGSGGARPERGQGRGVGPERRPARGPPAELNDLLVAGELDLSVISAVEFARNAGPLRLLPGIGITSDGPVRSVALFSKVPVESLDGRTVLLTASSRTGAALLELLCRDVWRVRPHFAQARAEAPDLDALGRLPHDAVLVIGDAALLLAARHAYPYRVDLGDAWKRWTGLPFVFAVWAARRAVDRAAADRVHEKLLESRDWGLAHLDVLAAEAHRV